MKGRMNRWVPGAIIGLLWVGGFLWQSSDDLVPYMVGSVLVAWAIAVLPASWAEK